MKDKISKGAKFRAGAAACGRRGGEVENVELMHGYAVLVDWRSLDADGEASGVYLKPDGSGLSNAPFDCVLTDYTKAVELCGEVLRKSGAVEDFPPPEFPRVVFVSLSASVVGVA